MAEPFCDANYPTRTTTPIGISHLFPSSDDIIIVEPKQVIQSFSPIGSPVDPSKLKADTRDMQSYDLFCSDSLNISHLINAMSPLQLQQQNAGWKSMQDRSYFVTRANLPQDAASRFASSLPQHASAPIFSTQLRSRSFSASSVQKPSVSSNASVNTTTVHTPTPEEIMPSVPPPQEEALLSNSNTTQEQNQIPEPDPVDPWMEEWLTGMGGMELELEGSGGRLKKGAVLLSPIKKEVPSSVAVASPTESVGLNVGNFLFNLNPQITDSSRPANANQFSAPGDMSRFSSQTIQRTTHQQPMHSMSNFAEPLVGNSSNPFIATRQTSPLVPRHRHEGDMRSSHESKILNPYAVPQTQLPPSPPASPTLLRLSHASLDNKTGSPRNYQPSSSITRPLNTCVVRGRAISNGSTNTHITSLSSGAEGSDGSDVDATTTISTRARSRSRSRASSRLSARSSHGRAFPSPELLRVKRGKSAAPDESQGFLFHHQPWPSPDATKKPLLDYRNDLADTDEEDELDDGENSAFNLAAATDDEPNPPKQLYQKWQGRASSSPTPSSMHLMLQRQQFPNTSPSPSSITGSSVSAPTVPLVSYTPSPGVDNSDSAYPYLPHQQQLHNYQHFDGRDHFFQHYHPQHHGQKRKPFPGGHASQSASSSPTSTPPKQSLLHSYQPSLPPSNANQTRSRPNSPARSPARSPAPSPARSPSASPETQLRRSHPTQTPGAAGGRHVHHHQHHQQRAPMPPHHLFSQAPYAPHLHHHPHHQNLQQEIIDPIVNNSKPNNRSRSAGSTILASKIGRHHDTNTGHSTNASPLIATAPASIGLGPALQRKGGGQESPTSPLSPNSSVQSSMSPESPQHNNYKRKGSKHAPQNHINNANTSPTLPHKNKSNNGMHNGSKDNSNAGNPSGMNGKRNRNAGNASSPGNGVAANPGAVSGNGHHQHTHGGGSGGGSSEDMSRFDLHLDKVQEGRDIRTTLMIKNIPNKYNQEMLLDTLNKFGYKGSFDFFYLPIDFKNKCNVGYAFINFIEASTVASFYQDFNQKKWEKFNSEKVCTITYARIQGKMAFIDHFRNSSLMYEDPACRPLIFHSGGPQVGTLEPFPPANVNPRIQRTQQLTTNNTSIRPPTTPTTTPPGTTYPPTSAVPTPSVATVPSPHHTVEQATNVTSSASSSTASEEG